MNNEMQFKRMSDDDKRTVYQMYSTSAYARIILYEYEENQEFLLSKFGKEEYDKRIDNLKKAAYIPQSSIIVT